MVISPRRGPRLNILRSVATNAHSLSLSVSLGKIVNWNGTSQDIDHVLTAFEARDYLDRLEDLPAVAIAILRHGRSGWGAFVLYSKATTQLITTRRQIFGGPPTDSEL